uniref:ST8 alpha-N-acetyl-neuraminide alpha-2,8-sialyltransferase 6 n=1 Tax=Spermophilus dauricus TaxID=99837 RepID=A0A8C9P449_SPEDA
MGQLKLWMKESALMDSFIFFLSNIIITLLQDYFMLVRRPPTGSVSACSLPFLPCLLVALESQPVELLSCLLHCDLYFWFPSLIPQLTFILTHCRAKLTSCCDAIQNFVVSQNNTPVGTNMSYEVESKRTIPIGENIFHMLPIPYFFVCAVVGNGGILNNSLCGAEIDKFDFVFRCNIPPTNGNVSKDVGSKTNLVTINPSIIIYQNLKKKAEFLQDIATYGDAFLLLPAFSYRANTGPSLKVYHTLRESKARQKVLFFHPKYLKQLGLFWRTKGVDAYRLSTGLMIASVAVEMWIFLLPLIILGHYPSRSITLS